MNLVFDLDSESFVAANNFSEGVTYSRPVTTAAARRREIFPLTVQFAKAGVLCDHDLGESASLMVTVKQSGAYASDPLAQALTFTKTGSGPTAVYSAALSFFTTPLEGLFAAVSGVEPSSIQVLLEVKVWNTTKTRISVALPITIANCLERDDDATPETSSPAPVPFTIGTVSTGAPGSSVILENVGTGSAAVLDITIPRGDEGPASTVPGPANSLSIGTVTTGSEAAVTIEGEAPSQVLNFVLPTGGGGGGGGWGDFTTQSAGFTAEISKSYFVNTTAGSYSVTLPNATGSGKCIIFSDTGSTWVSHPPAFLPAANDSYYDAINGSAGIYLQFSDAAAGTWFVLIDQAAGNWVILGGVPAGASLDSL